MKKRAHKPSGAPGSVRIIAGIWRGRRLQVPNIEGLRPSGDRSRETLFNWLQPHLPKARCVDLYAGTGVLGLEAVSRGAASAVLVEKSRRALAELDSSISMLGASQVLAVQGSALTWLAWQAANSIDIAFVDPPFAQSLAAETMQALGQSSALGRAGLVYLETPAREAEMPLNPVFAALKNKVLGEVRMQLFQKM